MTSRRSLERRIEKATKRRPEQATLWRAYITESFDADDPHSQIQRWLEAGSEDMEGDR